jgi:hypothetical protein
MGRRWGTGIVVVPAPIEVDELMRKVSEGKLIAIDIHAAPAKKHRATIGCPLTASIFAWVAANAAEEEREKKKRRHTVLAHPEDRRICRP